MKELLELNKYFRKYKGTVILGVFFLTVANGFLVWIPILIRQSMDEIEAIAADAGNGYQTLWEALFSPEAGVLLVINSGYLMLAATIYGVLLFATRQTLIVTSRKIEYDIRNEIFDHLQKLPQRYYSANKTGDIYTRATDDVNRIREYFGPAFMYTVNTITRAGIIIAIMILVNPMLTFWALLPLPVLTLLAYWISGFINTRSHEIQKQYAVVAGLANEVYSSIRLIKAYNREDYEQSRFNEQSNIYRKKKLKLDVVESLFHPTLNLLIGLSTVLVVWQGGIMVINGLVTVGNIAEFIVYVAYLTWPVASLGYTLNLLQRSAASYSRIKEMMQEKGLPDSEIEAEENNFKIETIRFQNVSFTYPGAKEKAVDSINLEFRAGENIAVVGRTGSGKSTLVQLLPRLFDPQEGKILVNGKDIREIPLKTLRSKLGFVPQETFLFSDTIAQNIAFGTVEASEQEIEKAAAKAEVLENILQFDKKFQTVLGERGITLSGGQKQRTSIARALIRKPEILILDDSLSAVDTKTEYAIIQHLNEELKNCASVIISHRISTVQNADNIYVMADGKIIEQGTHQELLARNGHYANMYKKQLLEEELANI